MQDGSRTSLAANAGRKGSQPRLPSTDPQELLKSSPFHPATQKSVVLPSPPNPGFPLKFPDVGQPLLDRLRDYQKDYVPGEPAQVQAQYRLLDA